MNFKVKRIGKIIFYGIMFSTLLNADLKIEDLKKFNIPTKADMIKIKNKYSELNKNIADVSKFESLLDKSAELKDIDKRLIESLKTYRGNSYMTKKEYAGLVNKVLEARKIVKREMVSEYIIYLTSESVPDSAHIDILHSVGILQANGVRIKTKQYLIGIPKDFKKFMFDKRDYLMTLTDKEKRYVGDNFAVKIDPRMFENFKVTKVPAIIYGVCKGLNPVKEHCHFKYMIRGDASLATFFEKISDEDPRYKRYFEYLRSNKL